MANTSAPLSEPAVASMAAGLLDDYHVTSLDDDTTLGRFMAREYGFVRDEVLEEYPWHFAAERVVLSENLPKPAFDWLYAYQLPEGWLRARPPSLNGKFDEPPIPYEIESGRLLCNVGPSLKLKGIRRETNMAKWTALAGRMLSAKLAMYACQRVTGKSDYFNKCRAAYLDASFTAKLIDSQTRGSTENVYTTGYDGLDVISARGTC